MDVVCFITELFLLQAYRAAMQTQWSWILQLCSCVEQHLKENAVYFEVSHCTLSVVHLLVLFSDVPLLLWAVFQRCQRVHGLP